jgi:NAD(P)-dependent dehydrogenase (short-subunit alcohol dehydrogenase family)
LDIHVFGVDCFLDLRNYVIIFELYYLTILEDFKMKKALVTGVSWTTGIGFAISKQLIEDGYYVYAVYHSEESTAKDEFENNSNFIEFIQCDLADRNSIEALITHLNNIDLDVIVNNAGAFSG